MWVLGYFHVNNAIFVYELGHSVFQFYVILFASAGDQLYKLTTQRINHFVLNIGFVRRGMYIL